VIVNPILEISEIADEHADEDLDSEGCLSVPGERFPLKRAERAIISGVDLDQKPVRIEADGWFARVFQHEFDHLDGTLYVDRLAEPWKEISFDIMEDIGWRKPGVSWLPGRDDLEA
jgi:peptide deformylase